ncbi:MAG: DUF4097 family beta strand repeat-containing protein [Jatrophihabitantaceae bacterium]
MTTKIFPLSGPINLHARIGRGSLIVDAQDGLTEATVTITARSKNAGVADRVDVAMAGPTLTVQAPREGGVFDLPFFGNRSRDAIDVLITVPSGTAVKISTFSADITVRGRVGGADIAAGAAEIGIEQVDGDLRLRYGSGSSTVVRVTGSVQSRSGSGTARFGEIDGDLSCGCGSGELEVRVVHGAVRSRSGSGSASLQSVFGDVDLASGSGQMSIGLPTGQPARLDVTTGSGRVNSELPIEDAPMSNQRPITVRARTGSGNIRLFRAA